MGNPKVLIVSTDPVVGALLGSLAELQGYSVAFDDGHESPWAAVSHHRPKLLLVDVDHRDGASDAFLEDMREAGIPVILYGPRQVPPKVRARAQECALPWLTLPVGHQEFSRTLKETLAAA